MSNQHQITPVRGEKELNHHVEEMKKDPYDLEGTRGANQDTAAEYLDSNVVISPEENKRLRRKVHKRILWLLCVAYITQSLDKGTLGTSSIMGWLEDVNAQGQDYALCSTFLWLGIICGEPIAGQLVRRTPIAKTLSGSMVIWTAILLGIANTRNVHIVWALRFLLGLFESTFGPCLLALTVQWYRKEEQPFVQAIWQSMLGASHCVASLLGFAFYHIKGEHAGRVGWQWMMITIAVWSFTAASLVYTFLPDTPTQARFLSEEDKTKVVERVRSNGQGTQQKIWKSEQAREVYRDPFTYILFALPFFNTLVVGGVNTFNSLLINQAFGFSRLDSQLLGIPLNAFVVILYMLMAYLVTKTKETLLCMIGYTCVNIAGTIVLITVTPTPTTRGGLIVAFYLMQCFQACNPSIFLMLSRNSAGQTKKSITYAITYMGWAGGNAIAPQIFQSQWKPRYLNSLYIHLALYGCFIITCILARILLTRRNKRKIAAQTGPNGEDLNKDEHAFEDLTDLQNPDFRYSV